MLISGMLLGVGELTPFQVPDLKREIALVGGRGRFEIWNLKRREAAHSEEHPTYQHVANMVGL